MIYTFTLNPSFDYIMEIDNLKLGEINRSKSEILRVGGKGINVSRELNNLGTESTACIFVAGTVGDSIISELNREKIKNIFVNVKGCSRINVKLACKNETAINGKGCNADLKDVDTLCGLVDTKEDDFIVLSGSVCSGLDKNIYAYIMEKLKGRFVVDAEKELLTNTLKYKPFLIKPNHIELGEIFECEIDSFDSAVYYGKKLCEMGAENVIVSMGKTGSVFVNSNSEYVRKANRVEVKNTVGAGDTMVAGFIHSIVNGRSFIESLDFAAYFAERKIAQL